jgi:hypothetical protein
MRGVPGILHPKIAYRQIGKIRIYPLAICNLATRIFRELSSHWDVG